eukprot:8068264-Ditylum_brightwellii.AAC.1
MEKKKDGGIIYAFSLLDKNKAKNQAKKLSHYCCAKLKELGGDNYINRILTPVAVVEVGQFEYNLITH